MSHVNIKLPTGQVHGPYSRTGLEADNAKGKIPVGTLVNADGHWVPLSEFLRAEPQAAEPQAPVRNVLPCPDCGGSVSKRVASCPHCGAPMQASLAAGPQTLPIAQSSPVVHPQYVVVAQAPQIQPSNKSGCSRTSFVLLGLFLGGLGIHNFYAGYTGRGVMQLLITVLLGWWLIFPLFIVGLWALVEIASVTQDSDGKAFT